MSDVLHTVRHPILHCMPFNFLVNGFLKREAGYSMKSPRQIDVADGSVVSVRHRLRRVELDHTHFGISPVVAKGRLTVSSEVEVCLLNIENMLTPTMSTRLCGEKGSRLFQNFS